MSLERTKTVIVDDSDSGIEYRGQWITNITPRSIGTPDFMSTTHETREIGASFTYTFTGTKIIAWSTLYTPNANGVPLTSYSIDGGAPVPFNSTGEIQYPSDGRSATSHMAYYTSPDLSEGLHTITVTVDQVGDVGPVYYFDYFTVETTNWRNGPNVIVDDRDQDLVYAPAWILQGTKEEYGSSSRQPPGSINSTVTITFTGTAIAAYCTVNGNYGSTPIAQFSIDGGAPISWSAPFLRRVGYNQQMVSIDNLAPDVEHTLVLTAIVTPNTRAWSLDYFVYKPSAGLPTIGGGSGGSSGGSSSSTRSVSLVPFASGANTVPVVTTKDGLPFTLGFAPEAAVASIGPSQTGGNSPSPVGAVVGGILGGIAALLLLGFCIFLRIRRNRRSPVRLNDGEKTGDTSFMLLEDIPPISCTTTPTPPASGRRFGGGLQSLNASEGVVAYRIAPAPYKGRLHRLQEHQQRQRERQRRETMQTDPLEGLSPSATPSSLPALSNSNGTTDDTPDQLEESVWPLSPVMQPQPYSRRVLAGWVVWPAGVNASPSRHPGAGLGRMNGASPGRQLVLAEDSVPADKGGLSRPRRYRAIPNGLIREVDAGVRLEPWDFEEELPDTLPPSYSRFR